MKPMPPWIWTAWLAHAVATSDACSFAIDAYGTGLRPASIAAAARQVMIRASSICVPMSASLNWVPWKVAIGTPNWRRAAEYASEASRQAWATPTDSAAMATRPLSSICRN